MEKESIEKLNRREKFQRKMEKRRIITFSILTLLIIVVIALLAAISVTVGVSMTGLFGKEEDKKYNAYKTEIENAACLYVEINNITTAETINKETIVRAGLIKKDLKNPKNNKTILEDSTIIGVKVSWKNNEKKCSISTS